MSSGKNLVTKPHHILSQLFSAIFIYIVKRFFGSRKGLVSVLMTRSSVYSVDAPYSGAFLAFPATVSVDEPLGN